jgi:hypothetical protein
LTYIHYLISFVQKFNLELPDSRWPSRFRCLAASLTS